MMAGSGRFFRILLLSVGTLVWLVTGGELIRRLEDNWRFDRLKLETRPVSSTHRPTQAPSEDLTYREDVDLAWFSAPPAKIEKLPNPELQARTSLNPTGMEQENYLWNSALLAHADDRLVGLIRGLNEDTLFVFPSYDGSQYPRFRLYPDTWFQPVGWRTNNWGWLSVDMTVRKPSRTIRIGIIGDSTSHNPYGLYLQGFLEAWAQARGIDCRFEVANTGRQGFGFEDAMATLKYELAPMGLDYVVEYFAPSFSLAPPQMAEFATLPPGVTAGAGAPQRHEAPPPPHKFLQPPLTLYSALARRIAGGDTHTDSNGLLSEPMKPHVVLHLPAVHDGRVNLDQARKERYFADLAGGLDRFKALATALNATPIVSTGRLCVWDGMMLREGAERRLYEALNGPQFWPFSYKDLRQMLAAHNGTIKAWAEMNRVSVVDIDGRMPRQPDLYMDPWHDSERGQRMRAWLIFQTLMPRIAQDLHNRLVPANNSEPSGVHPYLSKPIERVNRALWLSHAAADARAQR
jgi:hypothetical protein